jgi:hypothetical protein
MNYSSSSGKNPELCSSPRSRRNPEAIKQAMLGTTGASYVDQNKGCPDNHPSCPLDHTDIGLTLGKLEDQRWRVSPLVAQEKLHSAGLPYDGRRAGLIYSWLSIFRAEGIVHELAISATRQSHPHLFDDLISTAKAATFLGYQDSSSVRKLVAANHFSDAAFIQFGTRGVYRFRPNALRAHRKGNSVGRIV